MTPKPLTLDEIRAMMDEEISAMMEESDAYYEAGRVVPGEVIEAMMIDRLKEYFRQHRGKDTYHGRRIPEPEGKSRFTDAELRHAVEAAIRKNIHLFMSKK